MSKRVRIWAICGLLFLLVFSLATFFIAHTAASAAALRQGSSGSDVRKVQQKLKEYGYYTISVDGIYGPKTVEAVKKFQRAKGLSADGIVGSKTSKALGITLGGGSGSSGNPSYNNSDLYLMAKAIHGEARGEPYIGKVAVGAVILNRVNDKNFPNTISGVIYEPWAFTAVHDGQINLTPDSEALRAAQDAMNGWDPTYGAIYYYNPRTATSQWIFSRKTITTIGQHVFAI